MTTLKKNFSKFATSLIYIALGCALIFKPALVENAFSTLLAAAAILIGILKLVGYLFTNVQTRIADDTNGFAIGSSLILLGLFVLMDSTMFIMLVPFVLGFMIAFKGIEGIQNLLNLQKMGIPMAKGYLVASIVIALFGILVMLNPFSTRRIVFSLLGVGLLVSGLFDLLADAFFTCKVKTPASGSSASGDNK